MSKIYYDHAATTKQLKVVTEAVNDAIENNWYNVSSGYTPSFESRKIVTRAQKAVSDLISCNPNNVLFTSGATESNNMVIKGVLEATDITNPHIITTEIEHPAIYETLKAEAQKGLEVSFAKVGSDGRVKAEDVLRLIKPNTVLVSVMFANNETGVLQPIEELGYELHKRGILFHTDAVQAISHERIDVEKMNIDFLSASAHKMHGPKGIGFLYVKDFKTIKPLLHGGGQQGKFRSGTINNEAIAGYAAALEYCLANFDADNERVRSIRDFVQERLLEAIDGAVVNGSLDNRIPSILNISFPYIEAESLIMTLDMKGILVSGGSACATGKKEPSRVLTKMGLSSDRSKGAIRLSFGIDNTMEEAVEATKVITESVKYLQGIRL